MTADELDALAAWTNALGPTLDVTEPLRLERLGPQAARHAGVLESAGVVQVQQRSECPECGGLDSTHLEYHDRVAPAPLELIVGRPSDLYTWIEDGLRAVGFEVVPAGVQPTVMPHAVERYTRMGRHHVRLRVAIGVGEGPLGLTQGDRVLRLRFGAAPRVDDQARVVDVDGVTLLRDPAARDAVRQALDRIDVLVPLPLLELEGELTDRDRHLILDAARDFLGARGYRWSRDPNDWARLFEDVGVKASRGVFVGELDERHVAIVFCRCADLGERTHAHAFIEGRPQPALTAEPSLRQLLAGLARIYGERLEVRHRFDRLKELGEQLRLGIAGFVVVAAVAGGLALKQLGVPAEIPTELAIPGIAGMVLLRPHLRYARDALRLARWDWHVE